MSERIKYAKWFIDNGFSIFPIDPQTKKPVIKEWQRYSHEPLSEKEKAEFLKMITEQGYNYAIPGGQQNLVILDFDVDMEFLKAWLGKELDEICTKKTLCVVTPHNGLHMFLKSEEIPEHKLNPVFVSRDGKGIADLQSFNSYVVGVGSCINHKYCTSNKCPWKGQNYETCYSIYNNGLMQINTVSDLKGFLKHLADLGKKLGIELSESAKEWISGRGEEEGDDLKWFDELKKELAKHDCGKPVGKIKEEICSKTPPELIKKTICDGKTYSDAGIDRSRGDWQVIVYLMRHGVTDPEKILQLLPADSKAKVNEKWDTNKYFALTLSHAWGVAKKYLEAKKKSKDSKSTAKALVIEAIAEDIMYSYDLVTFISRDQLKESVIGLFHFNKALGIYEPYDVSIEAIINNKLSALDIVFDLGGDKTHVIRNIKEEIMRRTQRLLVKEPLRIAFKNGTLEWTDKGITWYDSKERTSDQYAFHYIDWNLKIEEIEKFAGKEITVEDIEELARRVCPKSLETFKQWVDEKWVLLFEVIGYTLYPRYVFNKAILLTGAGANGKTTFLNLLLKILGKHNVSAMPLKRIMEGDRFASIELFHKLANISSELFAFKVTNTDLFKKLTGEDYLEGQKKFKDPIYFINYAKLFNATNELPIVSDQSYGFWRRWIVIEFPHQFEPDPTFFDRTFTKSEIEGVIAVSVVAFSRVLQQEKFDFEGNSTDIKEMWERKSDSVYAFVKELLESGEAEYDPKNGDLYTPTEAFYQAYRNWCEENDMKAESKAVVTQRLQSKFGITKDRKTIDGKKIMCYVGIRLTGDQTSTGKEKDTGGNMTGSLSELYMQYKGKVLSKKELMEALGLRAYELVDWCEKRGVCHWIDKDRIRFD